MSKFEQGTALAAAAWLALASTVAAEPGVTKDEILLGGTNAMTGPVASVCYAVSHGSIAHFQKVNAGGGINGRKIRYQLLDDAYQAQRAIGNTRRLIQQDGVFAVFGGCGTVTAAGVLSVIERGDVPYLFPYAGLDRLVEPMKKHIFALMPLYPDQIATILPYAADKVKPKTAAILTNNIAGQDEIRGAAKATLTKLGIELVADELMEVVSPERAPYLLKLREKNPDLVIVSDTAPGAARLFIEMTRQGWKPKMVAGTSTMTDESFLRAAAEVAENSIIAAGFVLPPSAPEATECADELKSYNSELAPSHFTMFGCLSARVLVEALKRAGPDLTRETLIGALEGFKDYKSGLSGDITFGPTRRMGLDSLYPFGVEKQQFKILGEPIKVSR